MTTLHFKTATEARAFINAVFLDHITYTLNGRHSLTSGASLDIEWGPVFDGPVSVTLLPPPASPPEAVAETAEQPFLAL